MMLAEAVNETRDGPLKNFSMSDKDRYELKIAGLLHDCGKVTTPVHVVDKATKLETIFDRIALVDVRFEIIRRDAQLELRDDPSALEKRLAEIEDDRAFLRRTNIGGEFMKDEDVKRVQDISTKYRWRNAAGEETNFLTEDEVQNLTIRAGTLTGAERQVINHHITMTIHMLEALPWPKHLSNVV